LAASVALTAPSITAVPVVIVTAPVLAVTLAPD